MAAAIFKGLRTKFLLWFICEHDFESYPSDRELSYDYGLTLVMLIHSFFSRLLIGRVGDKKGYPCTWVKEVM